jgi:hypothetical protein
MMTPVIFFSLILGIVEVLQYFLVPLVLTNGTGEPGGKTLFYNLYLYQQFFTFQNLSYGDPWPDPCRVLVGAALGLLRRRAIASRGHHRPADSRPRDRRRLTRCRIAPAARTT